MLFASVVQTLSVALKNVVYYKIKMEYLEAELCTAGKKRKKKTEHCY